MQDWRLYQQNQYNKEVCDLLVEFLSRFSVKNAIDLGCGSGNESVYMLQHGLNVLAIDRQLNEDFILNRLTSDEKHRVSFLESSFEEVKIPKTELITAFFSIPFCHPEKFEELWSKIYDSLKENGYFVGQLFGNRDDFDKFPWINTFSVEKAKEYLKKYKVILFKEIEYIRESDQKKWHYYNIIAQKKDK